MHNVVGHEGAGKKKIKIQKFKHPSLISFFFFFYLLSVDTYRVNVYHFKAGRQRKELTLTVNKTKKAK